MACIAAMVPESMILSPRASLIDNQFRGCVGTSGKLGPPLTETPYRDHPHFTWGSGYAPWHTSKGRKRDSEGAA